MEKPLPPKTPDPLARADGEEAASSTPRIAIICLIGGALLLAVFAWRRQQEHSRGGKHHPAVGKEYLPRELPPLTATEPITAADLRGKVTLINFWGWWCGPCQVEFPHMLELEQSLRGNPDFRFVSVATSGDPESDESDPRLKDETQAFLTERNAPIVTYKDPLAAEQKRLVELSGSSQSGVPLTVVIDKQGIIRGFWLGYLPGDELSMREVIDAALK